MPKKLVITIAGVIIILVAIFLVKPLPSNQNGVETETETDINSEPDSLTAQTMNITSPDFNNNEKMPAKFTCDGDNVSPALEIKNIPENTVSLALIVDDPDAPSGIFVHWLAFNIDPNIAVIGEGKVPMEATQGVTGFDRTGYGGPCPPSGTHRYYFKLYALDTALDLNETADKEELLSAMEGHIIDQAELIGLYSRE